MLDEIEDFQGPVSLPGEPTDATPGTEQKIRIMTERAARREELFHPLDGRQKRPTRTLRTPGRHLITWASQPPDAVLPTAAEQPHDLIDETEDANLEVAAVGDFQ